MTNASRSAAQSRRGYQAEHRVLRTDASQSRSCLRRRCSASPMQSCLRSMPPSTAMMRPGQRLATPACSHCATVRSNAWLCTVKYCAPWSKLPNSVRKVAARPPGRRPCSNTVTLAPRAVKHPRARQACDSRPDDGDAKVFGKSAGLRLRQRICAVRLHLLIPSPLRDRVT